MDAKDGCSSCKLQSFAQKKDSVGDRVLMSYFNYVRVNNTYINKLYMHSHLYSCSFL